MPIIPKRYFDFCAAHVSLLHALATRPGDVSEAQVRRLIRTHAGEADELPETTWQRLLELKILIPLEEGSAHYVMAEPILGLIHYLHDEASPTSPEIIAGYSAALDSSCKRLLSGIEALDPLPVAMAVREVERTLRRIKDDLDATHRAVMAEVARYKTDRNSVSVRERYVRIVTLMDQYVHPLVEIVRVDGLLSHTLDRTDLALATALERGVFLEPGLIDRTARQLRALRRRSIHTLNESRRELQPLYSVLRRSSSIAHGATLALNRLQHLKLDPWVETYVVQAARAPIECPPTDQVLRRTLHHVITHPPRPQPALRIDEVDGTPAEYTRLLWLDGLKTTIRQELPVEDLTGWLTKNYPEKGVSDALLGLSRLLLDPDLDVRFTAGRTRKYRTRDGVLETSPITIDLS